MLKQNRVKMEPLESSYSHFLSIPAFRQTTNEVNIYYIVYIIIYLYASAWFLIQLSCFAWNGLLNGKITPKLA